MASAIDRNARTAAIAVFVALVVDGMDLQMLALVLPSLSADLGLDAVKAGALGTFTLIGMGIGGVLAGWLADRIGRVRVTWWAVALFTACTGVVAICQTYWQVALMRFMAGFGIAALYSVGTLLAAEYVPTPRRSTILGSLQAGWSVGYVLAALLASSVVPAYGWRPLFLLAIAPGLVTLVLLWRMPDPASWQVARASLNPAERPIGFRAVWRNRGVRRTFLLWTVTSIALQFGYYGTNTWLPSYLVNDLGVNLQSMGWYIALAYTMMVLGKVVTGYLADLLGRRTVWVVAGLLTAVYLPFLIYAATPANVPWLLLGFGFLYGAPYAVNSTYLCESFPASVRGTAVGTSYNLGRIGAMLSPLLIGMTADAYSIGLGIGLLGVSYAICALVPGLWIPEHMYDPMSAGPPLRAAYVPETPAALPHSREVPNA